MKKEKSLKKNSMYLIAFTIVVLVIIGLVFKSVYKKELTGEEVAVQLGNFIESFENQGGQLATYIECDSTRRGINDKEYGKSVWSFLAYASLYDATGDKVYVSKLQEMEENIVTLHPKIIADNTEELILYPDPKSLVMYHNLMTGYELVKGKNILKYEGKFEEILYDEIGIYSTVNLDEEEFPTVQGSSMISNSLSTSIKYLKESGASEQRIQNVLSSSKYLMEKTKENHFDNDMIGVCWFKLSEYNYADAAGLSKEELIDYFKKPLTETILADDDNLIPVFLHPCMEVLYKLYEDTGSNEFIKQAEELNNALMLKNAANKKDCDIATDFILIAGGNEEFFADHFYLADNAYQTYLMTRPKFKNFKVSIK